MYSRTIPSFCQFDIIEVNEQIGFVYFVLIYLIFDNIRKDKKCRNFYYLFLY